MTIYKVLRTDITVGVQSFEWQPVNVQELRNGKHTIEHNGLQVPISIKGDEVTVYLSKAKGNLGEGDVAGMGDDWTMLNRGELKQITVEPKVGEAAMGIYGSPSLEIERHNRAPKTFDFGRRK